MLRRFVLQGPRLRARAASIQRPPLAAAHRTHRTHALCTGRGADAHDRDGEKTNVAEECFRKGMELLPNELRLTKAIKVR